MTIYEINVYFFLLSLSYFFVLYVIIISYKMYFINNIWSDLYMRKALLIYNPNSGNGKIILDNFDKITTEFLKSNISLTLYSISNEYSHLITVLQKHEFDILILSGGDGTLSRTLTELYNDNVPLPDIGIFPTGTSNDFARCLNLGSGIDDWIKHITEGQPKSIDFGLINGKTIFLSSYAGGLFTKISYNTDKNMKKNIGKLAYFLSGINELINIKKFKLHITLDGETEIEENAILYMILNGEGAGGFNNLDSSANMTDGLMNLIIIKEIKSAVDLSTLFLDLMNNNFVNNNFVRTMTAKKCKIKKIRSDISISIDGEEGVNENSEIEFIHNKLRILISE